ncbi:aminoglycoside phosphotransferase family protein [Glaciimonas sp. PCH181]|uniref:aminoglycoside phosphotransferase family protein n=1 Tax=Glaciimonas sp. PCH181 TaxID=2133943 RepID=UPI000D34BDFD|nr:phosphotransferase [Glaciimonas sp. PCH181]PUA20459.1 aminoglycoside phosphotransferase [Glaciimonas sp. PCH181]
MTSPHLLPQTSPQGDPSSSAAIPDLRLTQIMAWLSTLESHPTVAASIRPASADASFRRYFRIDAIDPDAVDGATLIVMDAPQPQEDVRPFIFVAGLFSDAGMSTPKILAQDIEQGFLLLSDFGPTTYLQQLNDDNANALYLEAIDALVSLQTHSKPDVLPEYDRAFLLKELQIFTEWYIGKHLNVTLTAEQSASLDAVFNAILANNMAQPQVYVHRDYHSRNLMALPTGNPGVLDFQGALYGPITYDLASLLRDVYRPWEEAQVLDWVIRYWERAKRAGLPVAPDIDTFYRDFEYMGLQRHLKILGLFARLNYRDGKAAYMQDLPQVMDYVRKTALRYRELIPLVRLIDKLEETPQTIGYTF